MLDTTDGLYKCIWVHNEFFLHQNVIFWQFYEKTWQWMEFSEKKIWFSLVWFGLVWPSLTREKCFGVHMLGHKSNLNEKNFSVGLGAKNILDPTPTLKLV